jgi:hypothetical protein
MGLMLRHLAPFLLCCAASLLRADPRPGDVFREYHYTAETIIEFDPGSKQQNPKALLRRSISGRERSVDIWDLEDAERAEVSLEFWGGHPGTSGQEFRVNGGDFLAIPQIAGTAGDPRCYFRTLPGTIAVPLPLNSLKMGRNVFEFRAGPQVCHSIDWGIYKVYAFTVRIYYNSRKARPDGRIVSPRAGAAFGEAPIVEAEASGSPAAPGKLEFTPGGVRRVEFIGLYEDFNWEGDGLFRRWHYQTDQGVMQRHIGTVSSPPYQVKWDTTWLPDQPAPVQIAARITTVHGLIYMTPAVEANFVRKGRSVRLYRAHEIPEVFGVRIGKRMTCPINIPDSLAKATAARLTLSTWAGNHADEFGINGQKIATRVGRDDYYSYDSINFDPRILKRGENEFHVFSATKEHTVEINWPGPAILIAFIR